MKSKLFGASFIVGVLAVVGGVVGVAQATHSWGGYHWARTTNPLTLNLGDSVTSAWDGYLATASSDWSVSSVLDTAIVPSGKNAKRCAPTAGRIEVCNSQYGNNGWLGIASVWANGSHITQGTVKLNDTYFKTAKYNTPEWKNLVMCQEVGHTFGLDHQDETFDNLNLGTCMDYTNNPSINQHPNQHDYDELLAIYTHLDGVVTATPALATNNNGKQPAFVGQDLDLNNPSAWGKSVKQDARGKDALFVRDLGNGEKVFTFVTWAE